MSSSILFAQAGQPPKNYYAIFKSQGCHPTRSFYQLQLQVQNNPRPFGYYQFFRADRVISPLIALLSQQVTSTSVQEGSKEPASEGQPPKGYWHTFKPHVVEVVAASGAIVPVFWLFQSKSALQTGQKLRPFWTHTLLNAPHVAHLSMPMKFLKVALSKGIKAAPSIGSIVGIQIGSQTLVEAGLMKLSSHEGQMNFMQMLFSSIVVGGFSAPALAGFNALTNNKRVFVAIRALTLMQTLAIVTRETSFLFSLRISDFMSEYMKQHFGDNNSSKYSAIFMSGFIGSLVGHIPDTALTRWQEKMAMSLRYGMYGSLTKGIAVGSFSLLDKMIKEALNQ